MPKSKSRKKDRLSKEDKFKRDLTEFGYNPELITILLKKPAYTVKTVIKVHHSLIHRFTREQITQVSTDRSGSKNLELLKRLCINDQASKDYSAFSNEEIVMILSESGSDTLISIVEARKKLQEAGYSKNIIYKLAIDKEGKYKIRCLLDSFDVFTSLELAPDSVIGYLNQPRGHNLLTSYLRNALQSYNTNMILQEIVESKAISSQPTNLKEIWIGMLMAFNFNSLQATLIVDSLTPDRYENVIVRLCELTSLGESVDTLYQAFLNGGSTALSIEKYQLQHQSKYTPAACDAHQAVVATKKRQLSDEIKLDALEPAKIVCVLKEALPPTTAPVLTTTDINWEEFDLDPTVTATFYSPTNSSTFFTPKNSAKPTNNDLVTSVLKDDFQKQTTNGFN